MVSLELLYDRAGRSEGTAYVVYNSYADAREAVKQFDGANAKGECCPQRTPKPKAFCYLIFYACM